MAKQDYLHIRITAEEKLGFETAADFAGIPLSTWVRERLRLAAIQDLERAGRPIPFIKPIPLGGPNA